MLKFLRKIRKSLIESGSARKYLLYAIGEIALVVIGILIALQINNWNEWRKDQLRLNDHFEELISELNNDKKNLEGVIDKIRIRHDLTLGISQFINTTETEMDTAFLLDALIRAENYGFYSISKAAYSSLISSGDIQLIKNSQLKNLLSIYHDNANWDWTAHNGNLKNAIEQYSAYVHKFLPPLFHRDIWINQFSQLEDENFASFHSDKKSQVQWTQMKNDQNFATIISRLIAYRVFQIYFYKKQLDTIQEIVTIIESEML
jgi:hypothetical protein